MREKIGKLRDVEGEQYRLPEDEVFDRVKNINRSSMVKGRLKRA